MLGEVLVQDHLGACSHAESQALLKWNFWARVWETEFLQGLQVVLMDTEAKHCTVILNPGCILDSPGRF